MRGALDKAVNLRAYALSLITDIMFDMFDFCACICLEICYNENMEIFSLIGRV